VSHAQQCQCIKRAHTHVLLSYMLTIPVIEQALLLEYALVDGLHWLCVWYLWLIRVYDAYPCGGFMLADAGHDDIIIHAVTLRAASIALMHHSFVMMGRASTTVKVSHDLYEVLLVAVDRLSASLKQIVRARDADTQQALTN
jgi:hypothetical protein